MRLFLSIIILGLFVTYAVIPFVKYIIRFGKSEGKRIDKSFVEQIEKEKDDE